MLSIGGDATLTAGAGDANTGLTAAAGRGETNWTVPVTVWPTGAMPEVIAVAVVDVSNTRIGESGTSGVGMEKSAGDIAMAGWDVGATSGNAGCSTVEATVGLSCVARRAALPGEDFPTVSDGVSAVSPGVLTSAVREALRFG